MRLLAKVGKTHPEVAKLTHFVPKRLGVGLKAVLHSFIF